MEQANFTVTLCDSIDDKYRFGFNGMEKDNELKGIGNSLDFGARMYDSRIGRWLSLDPLAANYPSMSPYNFVGNSPLLFIDPDGKKIVLSNMKRVSKNGVATFVKMGDDEFIEYKARWQIALELLRANGFEELANFAESDETPAYTLVVLGELYPSAVMEGNQLWFNFNGALKTTGKYTLSPITVLVHELDHMLNKFETKRESKPYENDPNHTYGSPEEERVITGKELKAAKIFGDVPMDATHTRLDHSGNMIYSNRFIRNPYKATYKVGGETTDKTEKTSGSSQLSWHTGSGTFTDKEMTDGTYEAAKATKEAESNTPSNKQ